MVRTTLGAEVETSVTVSGSETVDFVAETFTSSLASNATQEIVIRPPSGFLYELRALRFFAFGPSRSGATSGSHKAVLQSETSRINVLSLTSNHDTLLRYENSHITDADISSQPPSTTAQTLAVRGLRADAQSGFLLAYENNTNSSTSETRAIQLWVRQIQVSE